MTAAATAYWSLLLLLLLCIVLRVCESYLCLEGGGQRCIINISVELIKYVGIQFYLSNIFLFTFFSSFFRSQIMILNEMFIQYFQLSSCFMKCYTILWRLFEGESIVWYWPARLKRMYIHSGSFDVIASHCPKLGNMMGRNFSIMVTVCTNSI